MSQTQFHLQAFLFFADNATAVEALGDISQSLDLKVSSRPAMVVSLTDNSTETFWESGEEDRNKTKWVSLALPPLAADKSAAAANQDEEAGIKTVAVHIDNGRDMANKVASVAFKGGQGPEDLTLLKQADVESRSETAHHLDHKWPELSTGIKQSSKRG